MTFQDLSPKAELLAHETQANKLFSLCLGKVILAATLILINLFNSTTDRHTNGLELTSEIIRATPRLEKLGNLLMSLVLQKPWDQCQGFVEITFVS